ncbi:MAG: hypothetical protein JWN57_648 [Frankiales bacterium]|nr:hypothetical protein [Frankiales bacterium]
MLVLGVLVRLHTRSPLWLDEALSVNIADLPLGDLPEALRRDGAPPLYYVLLHGWTRVFGTGDQAVRLLSGLFSLAALPLIWSLAQRLHSRRAAWVALLLLASNPFAVRYATEARMYSLLMLLVLAGGLVLHAALREPTVARLVPVAVVAGLLALTHYWSLFLLTVVAAALLSATIRGNRSAGRCLVALLGGGVLFLPWLTSFLFQAANTGAPWGRPPGMGQALLAWQAWGGGTGFPAVLLGLVLLGLGVVAVLGRPWVAGGRSGVLLRMPPDTLGSVLFGCALATMLVGVAVTDLQSSGYAARYSAIALVPALLAAALGALALPTRARTAVLGAAVALGLLSSLPEPFADDRTQAAVTADAIEQRLGPGDLVLYCPDQLGPAVHRLLPAGTDQLVYPTGGPAALVDWVDYEARNADGNPRRFAAAASRRASGAIWLVYAEGYRTYGEQCQQLDDALAAARKDREVVSKPRGRFGEKQTVLRYR